MCGIVGYIGCGQSKDKVVEGLSRLEYRGYDSAGIASIDKNGRLCVCKSVGQIENLKNKLKSFRSDGLLTIGHTRWATHGAASDSNSHPHTCCNSNIAVVHNGIIENFQSLKSKLPDHKFVSDTDTEVIAHYLELLLKDLDLKDSIFKLVKNIDGAFAIVAIFKDNPDVMVAIRKKSPLCIGIGKSFMSAASDTLAFTDCQEVVYMPDSTIAFIKKDSIEMFDFDGNKQTLDVKKLDHAWQFEGKDGFESYMLKEIYEQKTAIQNTITFYRSLNDDFFNYLGLSLEDIKNLKEINFFACGTSWHAALLGKNFIEEVLGIRSNVYLASEARYVKFFPNDQALYIAISQSGETADTLEVLRLFNEFKLKTAVITNVASSSMVREAGGFVITQAGPELAVASTKAFSTQVATLYWLAHKLALSLNKISQIEFELAEENLVSVSGIIESSIEKYKDSIKFKYAERYSEYKNILFLGRGSSYSFALEAALKLKEIAYIFVQTYQSGELKHGPIALIDQGLPVFIFSVLDPVLYQKLVSNVQEVKSRGAYIVTFAFEDQYELISLSDDVFILPKVDSLLAPLAMTGLTQYLVYEIAKFLGRSIDRPRNLAKSVTVE